jgi:hypothetical protein
MRSFGARPLGFSARPCGHPGPTPTRSAGSRRWTECLDWLLILNRTHLERVLRVYVRHYNHQRPQRGLGFVTPQGQRQLEPIACAEIGDGYRRDLLGGLLHEYYEAAT